MLAPLEREVVIPGLSRDEHYFIQTAVSNVFTYFYLKRRCYLASVLKDVSIVSELYRRRSYGQIKFRKCLLSKEQNTESYKTVILIEPG
jgi:hypothetical protein